MNIYPSEINHRIEPQTHLGDALTGYLNLEVHTVFFFCCFPSVLVPGTQHTCNEDNKQFCNFLKALSSTQDILEPFWDPERALLSTLFLKGLALKWRNSEFLIFMATDWTYSSSLFIKCKYDIFVKRSETIIYTYSRQIDLKM